MSKWTVFAQGEDASGRIHSWPRLEALKDIEHDERVPSIICQPLPLLPRQHRHGRRHHPAQIARVVPGRPSPPHDRGHRNGCERPQKETSYGIAHTGEPDSRGS